MRVQRYELFDTYIAIFSSWLQDCFMGTTEESVSSRAKVTRYPTECGVCLSDHIHIQPLEINFTISVSKNYDLVFSALREIQLQREVIRITTNTTSHPRMFITSVQSGMSAGINENTISVNAVEVMTLENSIYSRVGNFLVTRLARRVSHHGSTSHRGRVNHKKVLVTKNVDGSYTKVKYHGRG